ncbi:MAG: cytochrome c [Chthoniobacteraceae bacterium]
MLRYFFITCILITVAIIAIAGFRDEPFFGGSVYQQLPTTFLGFSLRSSKPPIQIFPDMKMQPRYDPQHESDFFADGRAARAPVAGTVPIGYVLDSRYSSNTASNSKVSIGENGFSDSLDYFNTGKIGDSYGDGFPVDVTPALLQRGQQRFTVNCAICHGATGVGNGIVTNYGLVGVANFQQERLRSMPDGQIFNTITYGKNTMGAYGSNIAVEDRWAIIAYIRALQRSQNGTLGDVADEAHKNFLMKQTAVKQ